MLTIIVNGEPREVESGTTLLHALESLGTHVPNLCHDPRLSPVGACRLCAVEVAGASRPLAACTTPVRKGMEVRTHTLALERDRKTLLQLLAARYPEQDAGEENPFLRELAAYGLLDARKAYVEHDEGIDDSNPYIRVDMSRCIYCYRCERICNDLQGQFTWRVWQRGESTRIRPDSGHRLGDSSCVSCGACADTCPSGALRDRTLLTLGQPQRWTRTTCAYCGVGCEMNVGTRDGRIVQVRPVQDAPVNKGHLCVKGRYAFRFGEAPDRVTEPMLRERGGAWRVVSWEQAIAHTAKKLKALSIEHGPDCLGVLGSARATNEENYLAQKFARVVLGTNNVDCCARVCHAPSAAALGTMLGTGAATNSFDDIERANVILIVGANATHSHPVIGARVRQAVLRGTKLIVVDPRRTELAAMAHVHLQLRPGTNVPVLNALANVILNEDLADVAFMRARVDGLEEFRAFVAQWTPERVHQECGLDAELLRKAARLYATGRPSMSMHGLGATEHVQGTEGVMCLVNLALLTGNLGRAGAGVNPLRGQNNVQGAANMGCEPSHLTGYAPIAEARARFEQSWQVPVPTRRGLDMMEMLDAAARGELKALYVIGYDVLLTNPNMAQTRSALEKLELVVVQDMFMNETAREVGTVFLPTASAFEKDGTFMNAERRVQRVRKVLEPPSGVRTDWETICGLAAALEHRDRFSFISAEQIWEEIRTVWPGGAGINYARLERGGLQWPCPSEAHPGSTTLHESKFARGPRAALRTVEYRPSEEQPSPEYPFVLITGRRLYQFNAGTMTRRTLNQRLQPHDVLDVSPDDALRYDLRPGDLVQVRSQYGETVLPVRIASEVHRGQLFATFHESSALVNGVTSRHRDRFTRTPEYKLTAVAISKQRQD